MKPIKGLQATFTGSDGRTYQGEYQGTIERGEFTFHVIQVPGYPEPNWVEVNGSRGDSVRPVKVGPHDHGFAPWQRMEYDSLCAKGRTYYDELRWYHGFAHDEAFSLALATHGPKRTA